MANLGTRTKNVNIVIRKNREINKDRLIEWLGSNCDKYAFIVHEKDINLEGFVEGIHYHIVITLYKATRLSTTLTSICDYLEITPFGVEIDKTNNLEGSLQYLIHKNDKQKTQHDISEVIHNWETSEFLTIMNSDANNGALTLERLIELCKESETLLDVIEGVGLGRYHLYRPTINDVFKEVNKRKHEVNRLVEIINSYNSLLDLTTSMLKTFKNSLNKSDKRIANIEEWENQINERYKIYE